MFCKTVTFVLQGISLRHIGCWIFGKWAGSLSVHSHRLAS